MDYKIIRCPDTYYSLSWRDSLLSKEVKPEFHGPEQNELFTTFMAVDGLKVFGAFVTRPERSRLLACGTFVYRRYRRNGISKALWTAAIDFFKPKHIEVCTVSDRGFTMVESLKALYPDIRWEIYNDGQRSLRDLKKGKHVHS